MANVTAMMGLQQMSGVSGVLAGLALYGMKRVPIVVESELKNATHDSSPVTA